jgi:hypothetical protein
VKRYEIAEARNLRAIDLLELMARNGIPLTAEIHQAEFGLELWYFPPDAD